MASADYYLCDKCLAKTFYDADVNYDYFDGKMVVLCDECSKKYDIEITEKVENEK